MRYRGLCGINSHQLDCYCVHVGRGNWKKDRELLRGSSSRQRTTPHAPHLPLSHPTIPVPFPTPPLPTSHLPPSLPPPLSLPLSLPPSLLHLLLETGSRLLLPWQLQVRPHTQFVFYIPHNTQSQTVRFCSSIVIRHFLSTCK